MSLLSTPRLSSEALPGHRPFCSRDGLFDSREGRRSPREPWLLESVTTLLVATQPTGAVALQPSHRVASSAVPLTRASSGFVSFRGTCSTSSEEFTKIITIGLNA